MGSLSRFLIFVGVVVLAISVIYLTRRLDVVKTESGAVPGASRYPALAAFDQELTSLVSQVLPSVVSISARQDDPAAEQMRRIRQLLGLPDEAGKAPELGSGAIVSKDGHIVTNLHVIDRARQIEVYLSDGRSFPARFLGADPQVDLAVLKIDVDDLQPLAFADSDEVRVGQLVFAIGNPLGLQETVTQGIISGSGRRAVNELNTDFFQTDAAINPGNSGGPLIDVAGRIIGINNVVALQSQGISFAIPSNLARRVFEDVVQRREISRPWFGAITWPLTSEIASQLKLSVSEGSLVVSILPNSPAARAGLQAGDVIESMNAKPARNPQEVRNRLAELRVGDVVETVIVRQAKRIPVPIQVEQQPLR